MNAEEKVKAAHVALILAVFSVLIPILIVILLCQK